MTAPRPSIGDRLYRALLRLYPAEFRGDFGDEMSGVFREQRRDERGVRGLAALWLRTVASILVRAPREQADTLAADLRDAVRSMRHHATSTAVIVLLLAVGTGANIAVFGFADPLILRPLPVPGADRIVRVIDPALSGLSMFSYPTFLDLSAPPAGGAASPFDAMAAHQYTTVTFGAGDAATRVNGEVVSGAYFHVFGIRPVLGRLLGPSDDVSLGAHPVVVISEGLWHDGFGSAPDVVGRTVQLNGFPFEVIGVAPASFTGSYVFTSRFWVPLAMYQQARPRNVKREDRGWEWLAVTARLRPGATAADANQVLAGVAAALDRDKPARAPRTELRAIAASGLPEGPRQAATGVIAFAATIVLLVLAVTCANIAGVLQARALERVRDTAVRHALGASRFRLVRQWLTESVVLAMVGAAGGLLVARWLQSGVLAVLRKSLPFEITRGSMQDVRIILFSVAIALVTSVLFGLVPALRSAGRGAAALRELSTTTTGSRRAARGMRLLVVLQVAICLALLVTAGLLTRSLHNLRVFDPGFPTTGLVVARIDLRQRGYDLARADQFFSALAARLRGIPGVTGVSRGTNVPLGGDRERRAFRIAGHTAPNGSSLIPIDFTVIGRGYFEALSIPVLRGRTFTAEDTVRTPGVAVINETMARTYWPAADPIGRTITLAGNVDRPIQVIGVARDIKYYAIDEASRPYLYLSLEQAGGWAGGSLFVRVSDHPEAFVGTIRREAASIDPLVTLDPAMTFDELRDQPLALRAAMATIATLFGAVALALTIIGVYGTMTSAVTRRTREIGVRMAFGAGVRDVFRLVLRDGLMPVAIGLFIGLGAAAALTRAVAGQLFGVSLSDPLTYGAAIAAIVVTSVLALALPARWATRLDPVTVLRAE